ncbi:MAG: DeoR/GlpR transcriptional regulator [Acidobacteriota bacterium]|nr:MAG: DeoR/GlpR transcriptional regulator [Acidobacteriota bacterium]
MRRQQLTTLLQREGYQSVATLAQQLQVSEATIRRDLNVLEQENRITRTHGGALLEYDALFLSFYQRNAQNRRQKERIARVAASEISDGHRVFLDAGSTVFAIAEEIGRLKPAALEAVTNSLPVAEALASAEGVEVYLLGGRLLPHQLVVVGPGAGLSLSPWEFDVAFLSAEGMDSNGLWNSQDEISEFQRHVCGRSKRSIFCVDDSKLGRSAPSFLLPWDQIDRLITTAAAEDFTQRGIDFQTGQCRVV